jgi:hypothetical protein
MNKNITFFILPLMLALFLGFNYVSSSGASAPMVTGGGIVYQGEVGRFTFYVFNGGSSQQSFCTYSIQGLSPLVVTFDQRQVTIAPDGEAIVSGSITAPDDAPLKDYSGTLKIICSPTATSMGETGASVVKGTDMPFDLTLAPAKPTTTTPVTTTTLPQEKPAISTSAVLMIIIIIIVAIGIVYWFIKKKYLFK